MLEKLFRDFSLNSYDFRDVYFDSRNMSKAFMKWLDDKWLDHSYLDFGGLHKPSFVTETKAFETGGAIKESQDTYQNKFMQVLYLYAEDSRQIKWIMETNDKLRLWDFISEGLIKVRQIWVI